MATSSITAPLEGWKSKVAEKQANRQKAIPEQWLLPQSILETLPNVSDLSKTKVNLIDLGIPRRSGLLSDREIDITESYDVPALLEGLKSGEFTSYEVTLAFSKRAAIAQQLTNCLTEIFFDDALERAKQLDDLRAKGNPVGPLHGLPVSLKDTYQVKGSDATIGAVAFINRPSKENSPMVNTLLELGAVIYVKTNVSQTLMSVESDNNVFGRVLNPWNTMLTAGGSSGGEGALIAFRGSLLGVGTDLAGSIRIPSLCCGTYGFRASADRVPFAKQVMPSTTGIDAITATAGPLASDFQALKVFMKSIIDAKPARHDSTVIEAPWRSVNLQRPKLRLGLLLDDPLFPLHPPVKDIITKAVEILRSNGHEIVVLDASECHFGATNQLASQLLSLDMTPGDILRISGEPPVTALKNFHEKAMGIAWDFLPDLSALDSLNKLGALKNKRAEILEAWREIWAKHDLDAVISPPAQHTAVEHDQYGWPSFSVLLSVLDYPACIIPFGKATNTGEKLVKKAGQGVPDYNPEAIEGAPGSIQVFTSRMRDEECLAVAEVIDKCLKEATV